MSSADRTAESSYGNVWWPTYVEGKPPIHTRESHTHRVFRGISRERWCRTRQRGRKRGGEAEGCAKLTYTGFSAAFGRNFYKFHHVRSGGEIRLVAVLPVINERHEMCHGPRERKRERRRNRESGEGTERDRGKEKEGERMLLVSRFFLFSFLFTVTTANS